MSRPALWLLVPLALVACRNDVQQQTAALTLSSENLAQRQAQMRRFETRNETTVLSASAAVLQDLGFTIEETAAASGLVAGSKDRDAVEAAQVSGQVFFAILVTAMGGTSDPVWDNTQKIRVSVLTRPSSDRAATVTRVAFQRLVWNSKNQVSKVETIEDPAIYQQFFDKLAQAVFLEAHQL